VNKLKNKKKKKKKKKLHRIISNLKKFFLINSCRGRNLEIVEKFGDYYWYVILLIVNKVIYI